MYDTQKLLSLPRMAARLGVRPAALGRIAEGLPHVSVGGELLFDAEAVELALLKRAGKLPAEPPAPAPASTPKGSKT